MHAVRSAITATAELFVTITTDVVLISLAASARAGKKPRFLENKFLGF